MREPLRRILLPALLISMGTAVPVAISPTWGWPAGLVVAVAGGAWLSRDLARRYVQPVERLAAVVRPYVRLPDASTEDLARLVAFEYRDAVSNLEEALAAGRRREVALRHAMDGVVLVDDDGRVEYANPAARALLHERVLELSRRLVSPELDAVVRRSNELGVTVSEEVTVRTPGARHVLARAVPLMGGGTTLLLQDLSEAYRLDKVRRDFVANVSHELKTPVAGMRALADVAGSAHVDGDAESAARFIGRLRLEAERLSELVADLLDLSSVEGTRELTLSPIAVLDVANGAVDRTRTIAESKGVALEVAGLPVLVEADPTQLGMAVQNLVDNAIRYSETGTVRVGITVDDGWVRIDVVDEGIGIPSDELSRIFERFYRVDRARSRATGGTGLGLSIVRHVAENHGGRVEVRSELGAGSTFTLLLPGPAPASGNGTAA